MKSIRKRLAELPPVKAARSVKWRGKTRCRMLPSPVARLLERRPATKRRLTEAALWRRADLREIAAFAAGNGLSPALREDLLWCRLAYGYSRQEYFCYGFADKSPAERRAFLSEREAVLLSYRRNDLDGMALLNDKYQTFRLYGAFFGREAAPVRSAADGPGFLRFAAAHPAFVVKPLNGARGEGVEKIDLSETGENAEAVFLELLARGGVLAEEPIPQSDGLARFHPASVNTVRVITFFDKNDGMSYECFLKTGRGGSFVDNGAAGGILAGIDPLTGEIVTDGVDESGRRYASHPDTGVRFRGTLLPDWEALLSLCRSLAAVLPEVRLAGWDLAHTDGGWVLVEANGQTELIGPQAVWRRGLRERWMENRRAEGAP